MSENEPPAEKCQHGFAFTLWRCENGADHWPTSHTPTEVAGFPPADTPKDGLRECPFCGGSARSFECLVAFEGAQWWVGCDDCKVWFQFGGAGRTLAEKRWNHRTAPPIAPDVEQVAREIIEIFNADDELTNRERSVRVRRVAATLRRHFPAQEGR